MKGLDGLTFGMRLRKLRTARKISQENMSTDLGFAPKVVSHWETDRKQPCFESLLKLADWHDVSLDYLMRGKQ